MTAFKFRWTSLLRLREATRDQRRAELAEAHRVDDLLAGQLRQVDAELDWLQNACRRAARPGPVNVDWLVETERYEMTLKGRRGQLARQRQTVAEEIERRRQSLVEADREVRVLEKLRERLARHRREAERLESRRLDEVAQQQALREVAL